MILLIFCWMLMLNPDVSHIGDAGLTLTAIDNNEISMKSKLNKDGDKVLILLELKNTEQIGFQLFDNENELIFKWNDRVLTEGQHELALPIPALSPSIYTIKMNAEDSELKHLLIVR